MNSTDILAVVWTVLGTIGVCVSFINLHYAFLDELIVSKLVINGDIRRIAISHFRLLILRFTINLSFLAVGVFDLCQPTQINSRAQNFDDGLFTIIIIVSISISLLDYLSRRVLLRGIL